MTTPVDFDRIAHEEMPQAVRIAEFFEAHAPKPYFVLDIGCGPGIYVDAINVKGSAWGIDNDDRIPKRPEFIKMDVTGPVAAPVQGNIVLSLEVGEHIPEENAREYIGFIRATGADVVYFSAAAPGQGGEGHINCQPKSYWAEKFCHAGFYYDHGETVRWLQFMSQGYHMGWLIQNGQVFRRAR